MRKMGGGFGMLMLVIVLAIVLLLAARNWQAVAPTAAQVADPGNAATVEDHGQTEAGEAIRSGRLPDLNEMRQSTAAHSDRVQTALEEIE